MSDFLRACAKSVARALLGDYSAYWIYTRAAGSPPPPSRGRPGMQVKAVDADAIAASPDALIREQSGYAGTGARAYACFLDSRIAGVCFYWSGERYLKRNFWPLADGEAKLVQIISLPEMRGRGIASTLIAQSFSDLEQQGTRRAYARIWHSNTPSLRAFERAGWQRVALVVEFNPLRRERPFRLRFAATQPRSRV